MHHVMHHAMHHALPCVLHSPRTARCTALATHSTVHRTRLVREAGLGLGQLEAALLRRDELLGVQVELPRDRGVRPATR